MKDICYTLKENISTLEVVAWVRKKLPTITVKNALTVAQRLKQGEPWNPPIDEVKDPLDGGPCSSS